MSQPHDATVDDREVAYYTRFAATWWDPDGPFWPLHLLNRLRVEYLRDQLCRRWSRDPGAPTPLAGLRLLDVGCGGGILSESMARLGASVTGIDVVERNIAIARDHAAGAGLDIDYRAITASDLRESAAPFDIVLNMEVVEHVADLSAFMADCCAMVAPGGTTAVATINRNPLAGLVAIFGAEYVLRLLPRGTHRYAMLRKPAEVAACLEAGGLTVADRTGVCVNPWRRRMSLTRSMAINYMLLADRPAH